ncbi:MAG: YggS family pyridoxal phosphate enzyme [Bacteroidales bacterium]|nr:YggS family pyridoxal phosphate enzyme [Bacteroidales bacterium]
MPDAVARSLFELRAALPSGVALVAVSKFHPVPRLMEAYNAGQRIFAESRPQELFSKVSQMPADVQWHFIGHLQTNKLKLVLPFVDLVQSVDSFHLLKAISDWSESNHRVANVLLELHLGAEETKQGFTEEEILDILAHCSRSSTKMPQSVLECPVLLEDSLQADYPGVCIRGLMGMATNTDDMAVVERDFERIEALFLRIRREHPELTDFDQLSIGMSADWPLAIRHGATMVRIGTDIFGPREY